jgi:hypothetical protein
MTFGLNSKTLKQSGHKVDEIAAQCWICREPADSAEHRLKMADIVRAYGKGPYKGGAAPVHVRGDDKSPVQGPRSMIIKYQPSLCHSCNTARTQPFDRVYDRLIDWIFANEAVVLRKRLIDFAQVYGAGFEKDQRNLFKYFVKSFGCRLVDAGQVVPKDLVDLLSLDYFQTALKITFSVNEDVLLMPRRDRDGFIGKAGIGAFLSKSNPHTLNGYVSNEHVSWFTANYWYGVYPEGGTGAPWIADAQHVYLGSTSPLTDEQRAAFLENARERPSNT